MPCHVGIRNDRATEWRKQNNMLMLKGHSSKKSSDFTMTMWWNAGTSIGCFKNTQWNLVASLWMQDSILVSGPMVNFGMIASMTKLSMSHLAWCGFANFPRICKQNSMTSKLADCTCERAPSLHATISSSHQCQSDAQLIPIQLYHCTIRQWNKAMLTQFVLQMFAPYFSTLNQKWCVYDVWDAFWMSHWVPMT